jgi:BMFP domain-containing protein YqiC
MKLKNILKGGKDHIDEANDLKKVLTKHENDIFSAMIKYRKELPKDAEKNFRNLRDAFFKGLDSIVKKHNLYD